MQRYDIINHFIQRRNYKSYLEVGTQFVENNFNRIKCEVKECIDPNPQSNDITYKMTSDEAFKIIMKKNKTYDIIFIDGLHETTQVDRDIENSLRVLNENGTIVLHDCNPANEENQKIPRVANIWNGDVWKSIAKLRMKRADLKIHVVDTDYGCGIITKSPIPILSEELLTPSELTWNYFAKNRKMILNLISVEDFLRIYS